MTLSIGVDIEEIATIERLWNEHGDKFLNKVFTDQERSYCLDKPSPLPHLAARYATKEATMKALKTGWNDGIQWKHIEVVKEAPEGFPALKLHKKAQEAFDTRGFSALDISFSHSENYVVATVLFS
ncbi:MAG: holo-ACP synthase [Cytophagales bacterium]|nr:holo-ACP synthase [Cytophagales bacterium]